MFDKRRDVWIAIASVLTLGGLAPLLVVRPALWVVVTGATAVATGVVIFARLLWHRDRPVRRPGPRMVGTGRARPAFVGEVVGQVRDVPNVGLAPPSPGFVGQIVGTVRDMPTR
jgi:hypothetical protein